MSEPENHIRIPENWTSTPVDPIKKQQFFEKFVLPSKDYSRIALGILAAGQTHFEAHTDVDVATLIYPHPVIPPFEDNEPFRSCLTIVGHGFKYDNTIDGKAELGDLVVLPQQLPSPREVVTAPNLKRTIHMLLSHLSSSGLGYISLRRATIDSTIGLGFIDPFEGLRIEESFDLEPLKELYGFPPSKPDPGPWHSSGVDHS